MADELNIPTHRWYQKRNHIALAKQDVSRQYIYDSGIQKIDAWINSQPWGNPIPPLFANGEAGAWYDPSDLDTLFQDTAGTTPVTTAGQAVGLMLDKSRNDLDATQPTAAARPTYGYHPLGGVRNRLTRTEEFDDAVWLKLDTAVTVDAAIDPDGALSADEIIHTGTSADIRQIVTVEDGINHTVSVYVKKGATGSAEWVAFTVRDNSASNGLQAWFNIDTGTAGDLSTFGVGASAVSSSVVDDGNGWYRCAVTGQLPTGITSMRMQFVNVTANGSNTRDQTSSIYIWGAQVEEGSTATDYQRVGNEYDVTEAGVPLVPYLFDDDIDDSLPATIPDLGTNATLAYATDAGTTILTGQTIGAGTFDALRGVRTYSVIAIDRALTAAETTNVTAYLESKRGAA